MSSNYDKTVMCGVCGKFMRDNNLKRHTSTKHGNVESIEQRGDGFATFKTNTGAEDVHHDRSLDNNPTNANNRDVLQSIHQPEKREMLKRYHLAQNIIEDARHSHNGDAKMAEYREAMQDFSLLRDRRVSGAREQQNAVTKKRRIDNGEASTSEIEMTDAAVTDLLPASQKENALKMLRLLRAHGEDVVSWTRTGDVSIHGERVPGTNLVDLVNDVLQSSRSSIMSMPQRENFLTALAAASVPEALIKNKTALELYREIKADYDSDDSINEAAVSSTVKKGRKPLTGLLRYKRREDAR